MARTNAPTWAIIIRKACKLSHGARWGTGMAALFGDDAADIISAWNTFCVLFEAFMALDDYPFEIDSSAPLGQGDLS